MNARNKSRQTSFACRTPTPIEQQTPLDAAGLLDRNVRGLKPQKGNDVTPQVTIQGLTFFPVPEFDGPTAAFGARASAFSAWLGSFAPAHEAKIATAAYALWLWANDAALNQQDAAQPEQVKQQQ